jgi:flavin reductase (DIM6/NTAB) family NADH-FMN oxidoreductase RutF
MDAIDPKLFRAAMGLFATGVTVISYDAGDEPAGMTANAFMSVSLDPPLVLVSVRRQSRFNQHVKKDGYYGVNFLAEDQQDISGHCGGRAVDGLSVPFIHEQAAPLIAGSLTHIVARVIDIHQAGDHLLYVGQVEYLRLGQQRKPLVFFSGKYKQLPAHAPAAGWSATAECW